jgi:1,4-dihydroxy-2-naphthoate octaprenyltransferase
VVPVLVGTACAYAVGGLRAGPALAALGGALLIQIGTNLANDVFDYRKGADTAARVGPVRTAQAGLLTPRQLILGMAAAFAAATAVGGYLTVVGGWPIIAIGVASIAAGILYTGGPRPLGYLGLGDVFVLGFFGFVAVCGSAYVQVGAVPALAWWTAVPVGALATAILVVNNLRDRETDAVAGKATLAVRWGRAAAVAEYVGLLALAYAVPVALWAGQRAGAAVLLPLVTAPFAQRLAAQVRVADGAALNPVLGATARLLLGFGVLLAVGVGIGGPP